MKDDSLALFEPKPDVRCPAERIVEEGVGAEFGSAQIADPIVH